MQFPYTALDATYAVYVRADKVMLLSHSTMFYGLCQGWCIINNTHTGPSSVPDSVFSLPSLCTSARPNTGEGPDTSISSRFKLPSPSPQTKASQLARTCAVRGFYPCAPAGHNTRSTRKIVCNCA